MSYRRPEHLRRTLEALSRAEGFESIRLSIHIDGSRGEDDLEDNLRCVTTANVFAERMAAKGYASTTVEHQARNRGLYDSILTTVEAICTEHGHCVLLEDDLLVAPSFLTYMSNSLERYRDEKYVVQISGHAHDSGYSTASFLPITTSWGWATWDDRWREFMAWLQNLPVRSERNYAIGPRFDFGASYPYSLLELAQDRNMSCSWAIRFYRYAFEHNLLTLVPDSSLISNIGFDGSGENCGHSGTRPTSTNIPSRIVLPATVEIDPKRFRNVQRALRGPLGLTYLRMSIAMLWKLLASARRDELYMNPQQN